MKTKIPNKRNMPFIDGGYIYDYYFRVMGTARSQRKLSAIAEANGMRNILGKPPSVMGCWKAMWRWACLPANHQKAYEIYNNAMQDYALHFTFEEFKQVLREHAQVATQFTSEHQRDRYFRKYKLT